MENSKRIRRLPSLNELQQAGRALKAQIRKNERVIAQAKRNDELAKKLFETHLEKLEALRINVEH